MHTKSVLTSAISAILMGTIPSSAQNDGLLPDGLVVEAFQGGWRHGGSDPVKECLEYFNKKYPTKRIQIVDSGEESKKDFWGHVEYKYRCTAAVKTK